MCSPGGPGWSRSGLGMAGPVEGPAGEGQGGVRERARARREVWQGRSALEVWRQRPSQGHTASDRAASKPKWVWAHCSKLPLRRLLLTQPKSNSNLTCSSAQADY